MDFEFTEEQKMFRAAVRDFLKADCPLKLVRQIEDVGLNEFTSTYRKMGQLGFLGVGLPEEYGGSGGSWLDLVILSEEAGAALVPNVQLGSTVLSGQAISIMGTEQQKKALLPKLVRGETVIAPAWQESEQDSRECRMETKLTPHSDHVIINGNKSMVSCFDVATHFMVSGKSPAQATNDEFTLALLEAGAKEVSRRQMRLQSGEIVADLQIKGAVAGNDVCMVGQWPDWLKLMDKAKISLAAYCVGAAKAALDMGVSYVKDRRQFGKPIGSFQAIQHKLAEAAASIELARIAVYHAAWLSENGDNWTAEAAAAKLLAGQAIGKSAKSSAFCHGAYGFSMDNDIQFYFRRIKVLQHQLGSPEMQKELIAVSSGF